ncbi:hypothetical protein BT96DRAFT_991235 [Gymnopus androsaceus JB14]|uniref:Uncharacterized protein n=1 Tax=Gymnopus androsaceus JB14 TaxID=1447944 RepID=A0A6A4I0X4_9AGAR|nr:hypothetical protein BT96DRAFT_991235 [Gymnopus androsaceus JB14]
MHRSHLNDFESTNEADYDCDSNYEFENKQSIRVPSPLSLSLLSESKLARIEPQHSSSYTSSYSNTSSTSGSSSGTSSSSRRQERYGRSSRGIRRNRDMELYGSGFDEEDEDDMDMSDEGYDSSDAYPRFRTQKRSPRRARTASPLRSPFSTYSAPLSSCSSPSFSQLSNSFPYSYSLSHPEELEDEAEISYPDTHEELQSTPSCNEALRRQWHALSLRVQFGVFRARRRMRGIVGKGKKY